jgi:gamma-glutamylcyclotransferase (GGCT)/AIG2-like uncharacterized protein YtfP
MLIFVYGTLKNGGRLHYCLRTATFIADAKTKPGYQMRDKGWFPIIHKAETESHVSGEIYKCDVKTVQTLDGIELSAGYSREEIQIENCPLDEPVFGYVYNHDASRFPVIESGEFKVR